MEWNLPCPGGVFGRLAKGVDVGKLTKTGHHWWLVDVSWMDWCLYTYIYSYININTPTNRLCSHKSLRNCANYPWHKLPVQLASILPKTIFSLFPRRRGKGRDELPESKSHSAATWRNTSSYGCGPQWPKCFEVYSTLCSSNHAA